MFCACFGCVFCSVILVSRLVIHDFFFLPFPFPLGRHLRLVVEQLRVRQGWLGAREKLAPTPRFQQALFTILAAILTQDGSRRCRLMAVANRCGMFGPRAVEIL